MFDYWNPALIQLEIDQVPRLGIGAIQYPLDLLRELIELAFLGFVQTTFTIEVLALTSSQLG